MVGARHGVPLRLTVLGSTGSVGRSVEAVVAERPAGFAVEALVAGRDASALAAQARRMGARLAVLADPAGLAVLREALAGSGIEAAAGPSAVLEAAVRPVDRVVAAISGAAGLPSAFEAARRGATIALANKEALVCAGAAFMAAARAGGATILPLDSEHNALFQAIADRPTDSIVTMVLTASGGPFRTWDAERIAAATPDQALAHPNWSMGAKITIDSASLMNKGLELIEAHHLFGVPPERLSALVHPQSVVHGLVSFLDGSVVAGLAVPDMRVPVAHCLGWPRRIPSGAAALDLAAVGALTFEAPDEGRFPCFALARAALARGGVAPTALNAANEVAVAAFLARRLPFGGIARVVEAVLERVNDSGDVGTIDAAMMVDEASRALAREEVARLVA